MEYVTSRHGGARAGLLPALVLLAATVALGGESPRVVQVPDLSKTKDDGQAREKYTRESPGRAAVVLSERPASDVVFRVTDQDGTGVAGATIQFALGAYRFVPEMTLCRQTVTMTTDADGFALYRVPAAGSLHFAPVSKPGYEFSLDDNPGMQLPKDQLGLNSVVDGFWAKVRSSSREHPFSIRVRRRGVAVPLVRIGGHVTLPLNYARPDAGLARFGILPGNSQTSSASMSAVELTSVFDPPTNTATITVRVSDRQGGVLLRAERLGEAPETGYKPQVAFTVARGSDWQRRDWEVRLPPVVLYVKLASPPTYARLVVGPLGYWQRDGLKVPLSGTVNPYGTRLVERLIPEDAPRDGQKLAWALEDEAQRALAQGRLVPLARLVEFEKACAPATTPDRPQVAPSKPALDK